MKGEDAESQQSVVHNMCLFENDGVYQNRSLLDMIKKKWFC